MLARKAVLMHADDGGPGLGDGIERPLGLPRGPAAGAPRQRHVQRRQGEAAMPWQTGGSLWPCNGHGTAGTPLGRRRLGPDGVSSCTARQLPPPIDTGAQTLARTGFPTGRALPDGGAESCGSARRPGTGVMVRQNAAGLDTVRGSGTRPRAPRATKGQAGAQQLRWLATPCTQKRTRQGVAAMPWLAVDFLALHGRHGRHARQGTGQRATCGQGPGPTRMHGTPHPTQPPRLPDPRSGDRYTEHCCARGIALSLRARQLPRLNVGGETERACPRPTCAAAQLRLRRLV